MSNKLPTGEARHEAVTKSLQQLGIEIREINAANGWAVTQPEEFADKYKLPAVLALIHYGGQ